MCNLRSSLAVLVTCLLTTLPLLGQQPQTAQRLQIVALEGANAVNYIPIRTATAPVVEVRDENDRPIEGASVVFTAPKTGPGAVFEGGVSTQTATTDFRGQASTTGYSINEKPGRFAIEVTATYQGRSGRTVIAQTNSMNELPPELGGPKRSHKKMWILLGVAAATGAAAGIYLSTRGNNTPISVGIGPVGIGGPR